MLLFTVAASEPAAPKSNFDSRSHCHCTRPVFYFHICHRNNNCPVHHSHGNCHWKLHRQNPRH
eukprot:12886366-Prorocentrum_lima.AAC.1